MKQVVTAAVTIAVMIGIGSTANAASVLRFSTDPAFPVGLTTLTVLDNTASDFNGDVDVISTNVSSGAPFQGFSFSVSTGTSNETTSTSGTTNILVNVQDLSYTGAVGNNATLFIQFTDNNLVNPGSAGDLMLSSSSYSSNDVLPLPLSVQFMSFADPNNAQFGTTAVLGNYTCGFAVNVTPPGAPQTASCAANQIGSFTRTGPSFSLTQMLAINLQAGNSLSNASSSTAVSAAPIPEPASLLLLGSGLAAASAAARRRRAKKTQA